MDKIIASQDHFYVMLLCNLIDAPFPIQKPCKYQFSEDLKNIIPVCHRLSFKYMQTLRVILLLDFS